MNFLNQNFGSSLNMCTSCKYIDVDDVSRSSKKCSRCGSELSSSDGNNIFPPYSIAKYISMLKKFIKDSEHESEKAEKEVVESVQDHLLGQNSNISDKKILETINGTQKNIFFK